MALVSEDFDFPTRYINEYLYSLFNQYEDINMPEPTADGQIFPFFPAGKYSELEAFLDQIPSRQPGQLPVMIYYDRMIRLRNLPFYVGKREQTLYTIVASTQDAHNIGIVLSRVLDREDISAQDINKWMNDNKSYLTTKGFPMKVFFRNMRVFQVDESRDLVELNTYKGYTMHKYIVEYDYHFKDHPDFL